MGPLFHVVLFQPEIPNNTGNIGRTCVALGCALHLIHPLGFSTGEKACRRAGLDYWPRLDVREHGSWEEYLAPRTAETVEEEGLWLFSADGGRPLFQATLRAGDHLVFGPESRGLPRELLDRYPRRVLTLPMAQGERSLNVAAAACAALYEGVRQLLARGNLAISASGRLTPADPQP